MTHFSVTCGRERPLEAGAIVTANDKSSSVYRAEKKSGAIARWLDSRNLFVVSTVQDFASAGLPIIAMPIIFLISNLALMTHFSVTAINYFV